MPVRCPRIRDLKHEASCVGESNGRPLDNIALYGVVKKKKTLHFTVGKGNILTKAHMAIWVSVQTPEP